MMVWCNADVMGPLRVTRFNFDVLPYCCASIINVKARAGEARHSVQRKADLRTTQPQFSAACEPSARGKFVPSSDNSLTRDMTGERNGTAASDCCSSSRDCCICPGNLYDNK